MSDKQIIEAICRICQRGNNVEVKSIRWHLGGVRSQKEYCC